MHIHVDMLAPTHIYNIALKYVHLGTEGLIVSHLYIQLFFRLNPRVGGEDMVIRDSGFQRLKG